jgi:hypothetical protein
MTSANSTLTRDYDDMGFRALLGRQNILTRRTIGDIVQRVTEALEEHCPEDNDGTFEPALERMLQAIDNSLEPDPGSEEEEPDAGIESSGLSLRKDFSTIVAWLNAVWYGQLAVTFLQKWGEWMDYEWKYAAASSAADMLELMDSARRKNIWIVASAFDRALAMIQSEIGSGHEKDLLMILDRLEKTMFFASANRLYIEKVEIPDGQPRPYDSVRFDEGWRHRVSVLRAMLAQKIEGDETLAN